MKRPRYLIAGLVLAHVVAHAIVVKLDLRASGPPQKAIDVIADVLFVLGPSQASLLAIWVAFGRGRLFLPVLPTVVGAVLYAWYFRHSNDERLWFTINQLAVMTVFLLAARAAGVALVHRRDEPIPSRPLQFSIRDMLGWMTALAVMLGTLHYMPRDWFQFADMPVRIFLVLFGSLTLVAFGPIVLLLCDRWLLARLVLQPLTVGLSAALVLSRGGSEPVWYNCVVLGFMNLWLAGSLAVVRLAGYRLTWRWRFGRGTAACGFAK